MSSNYNIDKNILRSSSNANIGWQAAQVDVLQDIREQLEVINLLSSQLALVILELKRLNSGPKYRCPKHPK